MLMDVFNLQPVQTFRQLSGSIAFAYWRCSVRVTCGESDGKKRRIAETQKNIFQRKK